eukprot:7972040-Alexandrium_andersonii.AAC.1
MCIRDRPVPLLPLRGRALQGLLHRLRLSRRACWAWPRAGVLVYAPLLGPGQLPGILHFPVVAASLALAVCGLSGRR